jgi:hypothetical protein
MRLQGFPSQNSINPQGWPYNNQANNLHLKTQTQFQDFIADAQFKRVTAEIVPEESKTNQSEKYRVYARIDENRKEHENKNQRNDKSSKPDSRAETQTASTVQAPSQKDNYSSERDLNSELKKLRQELKEVKNLALANQKALDSLQPMPVAYKSGYQSPNNTNSGSTLSQAEIHFLRYGSPKPNLDIWA